MRLEKQWRRLKNNSYTGTSDCKKFVNGIKGQVPSYKSTLKQKTGITLTDFKRRTKAIKYWASHGSKAGRLWGSASGVDFNVHDIANFKWSGSWGQDQIKMAQW
ncbi:hypothetical protein E5329_06755 [Petralouisia muris]|uniref:Uncharacterized protein n=1 Tax=Petralouisia muris TaxID=3032872 RepID=A0AC61RZB1_9FIRM|nr:hypothetical protein [Petralouisia muris]TGY97139.1 hypothetical protein E5329_06755 [Petralouisia muris]